MPKTKKVNKKKNTTSKKDIIIKTITVIAIIIVLAIVYNFINNLDTIRVSIEEHQFYQYFYGEKVEYTGSVKVSRKNDITELTAQDKVITLDSTPIYYKDINDKVIFPENMAIVFPLDGGKIYKVNSLSTIYIDYGNVYLEKGKLNKQLTDTFLYDGNDLYFFVEETTVIIGDQEYKLSPLSYLKVQYKGDVEIYELETDTYTIIEKTQEDVIAKANNYSINLSTDILQYGETEQLLIKKIKNLTNIE